MIWVTRPNLHVDRAACAWLIRRFIDVDAEFRFLSDAAESPAGATAFDMRGAELSHHGDRCSFETFLVAFDLKDPALDRLGRIVHEADLGDERFDAPEAAGLDAILRGLGLLVSDAEMLDATAAIFEGLYAFLRDRHASMPLA